MDGTQPTITQPTITQPTMIQSLSQPSLGRASDDQKVEEGPFIRGVTKRDLSTKRGLSAERGLCTNRGLSTKGCYPRSSILTKSSLQWRMLDNFDVNGLSRVTVLAE